MWFKKHSPQYRELISYSGKVIAIWCSSRNCWRERTDEDDVKDWEEYENESADHLIIGEEDAFQLTTIYP